MNELNLGNEKIIKLIKKFSIPCVISMVVAALYNIVDQIYIGNSSAGAFGNAATNIIYPFTVLALGLALLVGDGASANFSLFLGAGDKSKANKSINNGLLMLALLSLVIVTTGLVFRTQILSVFGADPEEAECYQFAKDYYTVICIGVPFYVIGQGLNGCIRADGAPGYAMVCTLAGAVANIILDPVLIFTLKMSVKGAAIATVIGQVITFMLSVIYLLKAKNFHLKISDMRFRKEITPKIITLGMASLIVQFSIVIICTVNNNLFSRFGYETIAGTGNAFGAVIPLAVVGIVMKVFGIVVSVVIGISLGGQPVIGYNMGAGNIERVKKTILTIDTLVLIVGAVAFAIFELAPEFVISIFGKDNSAEYMEFARSCVRIFLSGIILTCFIKASSIVLQSMGNSLKSTVVALVRDVIIFVPATVIIAFATHNIIKMLWAALVADVIGAVVALVLVIINIRKAEKTNKQ